MPSPFAQQLRKATFAISSVVFVLLLRQLWDRHSFPSPEHLVLNNVQAGGQNHTKLEDFPKRIWTTGPLSLMRLKTDDMNYVRTWMDQNQEYRFELLTDASAEAYVIDNFAHHDKILNMYLSVQDYILRADLIRYLVLLKDGGVYNDVDVGCIKPIDLWIPPKFKDKTSVVLGIEVDNEMGPGRSKLFSLVNWTIMARRNAPFIRYLVENVLDNLDQAAHYQDTTLADLKPKRQEVLEITGPGALTQAAFQYLSEITTTNINIHNFTKMRQPKLVGDILVLPINAFGGGHQVQWSGTDENGSALVHHYYAGSWKTDHFDEPTEEEMKAEVERKKAEDAKKKAEDEKGRRQEEEAKKKKEEAKKEEVKKEEEAKRRKADEESARTAKGTQTQPNAKNETTAEAMFTSRQELQIDGAQRQKVTPDDQRRMAEEGSRTEELRKNAEGAQP
ncbi:MAG: hypothetical protein LQ352_002608 [Teloschistes flavicans]|nr:MAG: hypothetical protein LQ352_002608 [Teloschistes flavicans]